MRIYTTALVVLGSAFMIIGGQPAAQEAMTPSEEDVSVRYNIGDEVKR